jgi:putative tricarboxylic transport membrane protein
MILARGNLLTFVERPVSAALLVLAVIIIVVAVLPAVRRGREEAFQE